MSREVHAAFCEGLRVRFPWSTLLVVLVDGFRKWRWLVKAVMTRLRQEFQKLGVELNTEKTKVVDLSDGGIFSFLGFHFRRAVTRNGKIGVLFMPTMKARKALTQKLKHLFRRFQSQPISRVISIINPILRGWVNYFRVGMSSRCFGYIKDWVEKMVRRHLMKARGYRGFGWDRWSRSWLYKELGLFHDYYVQYRILASRKCCQAMNLISFYMKSLGQRSAGKPPAALDVAGAGDVLYGNAPVLDPTCERLGQILPRSTRLLVGIPPQLSVSRAVQYLKGKSSRRLLTEYRVLRKRYWGQHLGARGYWVASSGNVTDEVWKEYIKSQTPPEPEVV